MQFLPDTVVSAWLSSSLLPWNGVSSLLVLNTIYVCDIRLSDVLMSLNILFGCSQTMNAWNVVTNFFNVSTTHIMHLVACQTTHLLFFCYFPDQSPNESPARLKVLTSVAFLSVTMLAMDASMRAFFLICCEILDSRSECSFLLPWYLLLFLPMPCCLREERISFQCGLTELSFHFCYVYFPMYRFPSAPYAPKIGHSSNPELLSRILTTYDAFLKVLIGNIGIWLAMSWRTSW